jgi:hypothetical protein
MADLDRLEDGLQSIAAGDLSWREAFDDCEAADLLAAIHIAKAAMRFYDGLDVDGLLPEYFGSGSDGYQYRGLRDAVRAFRKRNE